MNRPILIACIGIIIGIIWGLYFNISAILFLLVIILCLKTICIFLKHISFISKIRRYCKIFLKFNIIVIFLCSIFFSLLYTKLRNDQFESIKPGTIKDQTGEIQSEPNENKYTYSYKIKIKGNYYMLYVKKEKGAKEFEYGDVIKLSGELELPEGARNYGGFSQKNYFKSKNLYGIIYAEKVKKIGNNISIGKLGSIVRIKIKEKLKKYLSEENANVLSGILIGDKSGLTDDVLEDFRKSSLIHILCVSRSTYWLYY